MQVSLREDDIPQSSTSFLTPSEQQLINNYRQLNEEGQEKLLDHSIDLVSLDRYKKSYQSSMAHEA